jgi:triosephosphate isomerase
MIAGNWKMNLSLDEATGLVKTIASNIGDLEGVDVLVAPPFTSLSVVREAIGKHRIFLAAQNMHWAPHGAYTGEISGRMLVEAGCTHVIVGHSERRIRFKETSAMIDRKARAAVLLGLIPLVCIGETLEEREDGRTFDVIGEQLNESLKNFRKDLTLPPHTILAYEPVWAIGTGQTATPEQAQEVHHFIREWIQENFDEDSAAEARILYGGSVKPENIEVLMSELDIDGALVGAFFVRISHHSIIKAK